MILIDDTPPSPSKVQRELAEAARTAEPEEGPSPPAYPGYSSYQRGEPIHPLPSSSVPAHVVPKPFDDSHDRNVRRRARRRFLKAFLWAILIHLVVGTILGRVIILNGRGMKYYTPTSPQPGDGQVHNCFISNSSTQASSGPLVTLKLPINSAALYLFSRGDLATGSVTFRPEMVPVTETFISVDVTVSHRYPTTHGLVQVCSLERAPSQRGIGIFTPLTKWPGAPVPDISVVVRLPMTVNAKARHIPSFETDLPHFTHEVGNLQDKITFDNLTLRSTDAPIHVLSAEADIASLKSTSGHIVANFTTYSDLSLTTSNGLISAHVKLHNLNPEIPTRLRMSTSNAQLTSFVDLSSDVPEHTGGAFDVYAETTNSPLRVTFPVSPPSAHLNLITKTTNSLATVNLHRQFEGSFWLKSGRGTEPSIYYNRGAEDPEDEGRSRIIAHWTGVPGTIEGSATWGFNEEAKKASFVSLQTTNSPAILIFS